MIVLAAAIAVALAGQGDSDKTVDTSTLAASEQATTTTFARTIVTHSTTTTEPTTTTTALPPYDLEWAKSGGCERDGLDFMTARGTIKNQTYDVASYSFHVEYVDTTGVRVAEGYTFVNDLAAGQTSTWEALLGQAKQAGQCRIISIEAR